MIKLYAIQARFGDCLLLEYGNATSNFILIDGGPSRNYDDHVKPALTQLLKGHSQLQAVIISHVDNDHIVGVLDLLVELKYQRDAGNKEFVTVKQLWFNSFKNTIDTGDMEARIRAVNTIAGVNGFRMQEMSMAVNGIKEGHQVMSVARFLDIPVNPDTPKGCYIGGAEKISFQKENLKITVVGPTTDNLKKLQVKWEEWIAANEQKIAEGQYTKDFAAMSDRSIPNLSSIVLLVEADGKKILLTGDCRGDHLKEGLMESGLSADGKYHVDIFKVPHHGSARNVTREFFSEITADQYIISADGTYGNPDYETLCWIVETAKEGNRKIKIIFTNETDSTKSLLDKYPQSAWDYKVEMLEKGQNYLVVQ